MREKGVRGIYRGFVATTLKQSATTAVRMGSYSVLKQTWKRYEVQPGTMVNFVNGATAGTLMVLVTQPLDVVKTRCQSVKGAGLLEAMGSVMKDHGVRG